MRNLATALTICLLFIAPSVLAQNAEENNKKGTETADTVGVIQSVMNLYKLKEDITGLVEKIESTRLKGKQLLGRIEHNKDSLQTHSKKMWAEINELERSGDDKNMESAKMIREKVKRVDASISIQNKDIAYLKSADTNAKKELQFAKEQLAEINLRIKEMKE
jgi:hypothetical protein